MFWSHSSGVEKSQAGAEQVKGARGAALGGILVRFFSGGRVEKGYFRPLIEVLRMYWQQETVCLWPW